MEIADKPMYKVAKTTSKIHCECGCLLPVSVGVSAKSAALKTASDLAKAKVHVENLGPDIRIFNIE